MRAGALLTRVPKAMWHSEKAAEECLRDCAQSRSREIYFNLLRATVKKSLYCPSAISCSRNSLQAEYGRLVELSAAERF